MTHKGKIKFDQQDNIQVGETSRREELRCDATYEEVRNCEIVNCAKVFVYFQKNSLNVFRQGRLGKSKF